MTRRAVLVGVALAGATALAAFLRLWDIERAGLGSLFYASAVRSMSLSWSNFLYAAYDPAGTITVDKPPLGLWLQVIAVQALGFEGFALHLPMALAGTLAAPLTFAAARRGLDVPTGLLAALLLAVFPESVATARDTTMDALVLAMLVGAAGLLLAAVETRSRRLLIAWAVLMGLLFNVKMFEGFVVLPAAALYVLVRWRRELRGTLPTLLLATVVGVAVAGSWLALVDLTPAVSRPRVMNSYSNSALDLALRYNGLERVLPGEVVVFTAPPGSSPAVVQRTQASARRFGVGEAGPLRLFTGSNGPLLGAVAILGLAGIGMAVSRRRDWLRGPGLFWIAWCTTGLVLFSFSNRAAAHYNESYAPALAVLAAVALVEAYRVTRGWRLVLLPLLVLLVAVHAWYGAQEHPPLRDRITVAAAVTAALALLALLPLVPVLRHGAWPAVLRTPAVLGALTVPLVVGLWIALDAPHEARAITQPNPLVYASTNPPEPALRLPLDQLLALPASPEARYRFAIDGISRAGEAIALSGASVLPLWNEFLREPVLAREALVALLDGGDVPWVVLSRPQADSSAFRPLRTEIEARCAPSTSRALGPAFLLYECRARGR